MGELIGIAGVVALPVLAVVFVAYLGWWLAIAQLRQERSGLRAERNVLDAQWRALDNTRRVREVFLVARRAMQREAQRQYHRGGDDQ